MTQHQIALMLTVTAAMLALSGCGASEDAGGAAQVKVQPQTEESKQQLRKMGEANARALANMGKGGAAPGAPAQR